MPKVNIRVGETPETTIIYADLLKAGATASLFKSLDSIRHDAWKRSKVTLFEFFDGSFIPLLKKRLPSQNSRIQKDVYARVIEALEKALVEGVISLPERLAAIVSFCERKSSKDSGEKEEAARAYEGLANWMRTTLDLYGVI